MAADFVLGGAMDRTTMMTARVFAPAGAALLAALVLMLAGWNLATLPLLAGIASAWSKLVGAAVLAAIGLGAYGLLRLWWWNQGRALGCPNCGGLLGLEREGQYGPYRRCLACDKNISRINYA